MRLLENQSTKHQPCNRISQTTGKLRVNLDSIPNSRSELTGHGEAQMSRSQEACENSNSPSTPQKSNDASRNVILFANDRCTIKFDMKLTLNELESYYASFIEHNIPSNSKLPLKSSQTPTDDSQTNFPILARALSELDASSIQTMPAGAANDMRLFGHHATSEGEHAEGRNLEGINEEANEEPTGANAAETTRYRCSFAGCNKEYRNNWYLEQHEKEHGGVKPYKCPECNKDFYRETRLLRHIDGHNKPFKCDTCGQVFGRNDLLIDHKNTHLAQMPFNCEHCNKSYPSSKSLHYHMQSIHHPESHIKCPFCTISFPFNCKLKRHINLMHPGNQN